MRLLSLLLIYEIIIFKLLIIIVKLNLSFSYNFILVL